MEKFVSIAYGMIAYDTAIVYMDDDKSLTFEQALDLAMKDMEATDEMEFDPKVVRLIAYQTKEFEGGIH